MLIWSHIKCQQISYASNLKKCETTQVTTKLNSHQKKYSAFHLVVHFLLESDPDLESGASTYTICLLYIRNIVLTPFGTHSIFDIHVHTARRNALYGMKVIVVKNNIVPRIFHAILNNVLLLSIKISDILILTYLNFILH